MHLLLVEDDLELGAELQRALSGCGLTSEWVRGTKHARALTEGECGDDTPHFACVLLDSRLPDGDGIDLTRRIRAWNRVPIIVLSARGREEDKVAALDEGADDYLTKPFGVNELLARIRAAMRRSAASTPGSDEAVLEVGSLRIDQARREVTVADREVRLTPIEYRLLVLLAANAGKVLTHRQILKEVWGPPYVNESHYLRVFMATLRRKVEEDPARPRLLLTEPGVGYRMKET